MREPDAVVVTGLGVLSTLGSGRRANESALLDAASSGIGPHALLEPLDPTPVWGGSVPGPDCKGLGIRGAAHMGRAAQLAVAASRLALVDAGLSPVAEGSRAGVVLGTCYGAFASSSRFAEEAATLGPRYVDALLFPNTVANSPAGFVSITEGLTGPNATVSNGPGSGAEALRSASELLREGEADVVLAGAADSPGPWVLLSLLQDGRLARAEGTPVPPGGGPASGLQPAEGAAVLVLEREGDARRRGATLLARLAAVTGPETAAGGEPGTGRAGAETGPSARRLGALHAALAAAGIEPGELGALLSAATGEPATDAADAALLAAFLRRAGDVPVAVPAARFGHAFGAASALAAAAAILILRRGQLPPGASPPGPGARARAIRGPSIALVPDPGSAYPVAVVLDAP